jgi:hypothetical protein
MSSSKHSLTKWKQWSLCSAMALASALPASQALAAGTAAGTSITNKATLTFSVGGVAQTGIESSPTGNAVPGVGAGTNTSFLVDRKVNLVVTTLDTAPVSVAPGATTMVTRFTVTNSGNSVQDIGLTAGQVVGGTISLGGTFTDNFNASSCTVVADSAANNGSYDAGVDTATYVDELAADASKTVFALCSIPLTQVNGDVAIVSLTAQALVGGTSGSQGLPQGEDTGTDVPGTVQTVFGDAAGSDDAVRDGKHSARSAYRVLAALLSVGKTETLVCDPFNANANPKHIPGAIVRYAITVSNSSLAGASATLSQIADTLNANLTFDNNYVTGATTADCVSATGAPTSAAGAGFRATHGGTSTRGAASFKTTSGADSDGAAHSAGTVTVTYSQLLPAGTFGANTYTAGEVKPGESVTIEFQATVN